MSLEKENKISSSNQRMRTLGCLINPPTDNPNIPVWPYVIGLAGGVASGKSKIIEKLKTKSVAIVNCDRIANEKKLRKVAFADEEQPKQQDSLAWPAVIEEAKRRIQEFGEEGYRVVVMESADLMRAKWYQHCHQLWVVVVPRDESIKRLQDRDHLSAAEAAKRVDSQVSNQEHEAHANVIFNPLWSYKHTEGQVDRAWKQLEEFLDGGSNETVYRIEQFWRPAEPSRVVLNIARVCETSKKESFVVALKARVKDVKLKKAESGGIMKYLPILILGFYGNAAFGNLTDVFKSKPEDQRIEMIVEIVTSNFKKNGWDTILCVGNLPNEFYNKIKHVSYAFVVMNLNDPEDYYVDDVVPYHSNVIIINCQDFEEYEELIQKLITSPYWHPLANIIIYYHKKENTEVMARIFFSLWYHKAINAILVQYDDEQQILLVSDYTPFVNEKYIIQPDNKFGCWTARNLGMPVRGFEQDLVCVEKCHNITITSKLRTNHLGTCLGFNTNAVSYSLVNDLRNLNLFEDRSKNLKGFAFTGYIIEVRPFARIDDLGNGTYVLRARDGTIWNTMAKLMNFTIDLSLSVNVMKKPFNFEVNIEQIFAFARRRGDLCLFPIYQFDVIVVEVDFTFPIKDSGICIVSGRAGFETTIFQVKNLKPNLEYLIRCFLCFVFIWVTFSIFKTVENGRLTFDQIGKDLMNTCRNVLMLNLHNPPKYESFRIFLIVSLWCFFVINFSTQAMIISFFTAAKRGKEVDTFDDVIEKGYPIEAMASPDLILPDTEEKFITINSRLVYEQDIYGCITRMATDTHRFCLLDCSVGRYIRRNTLNAKGEQYMHIAERDRIHSHYLSMVLSKHSPLTERYNRYMMMIFEAGLISKWEQYKYTGIKDEATTKPLGMDALSGIFEMYCICVAFTIATFLLELIFHRMEICWKNGLKFRKCRRFCIDEQRAFWKRKPKQNTE